MFRKRNRFVHVSFNGFPLRNCSPRPMLQPNKALMTSHCAVISGAEQKHVYFFPVSCLKKNVSPNLWFASFNNSGSARSKICPWFYYLSGLLSNEVLRAQGKWICLNDSDSSSSFIVISSQECGCEPWGSVLAKACSNTMKKVWYLYKRT